MCAYNWRKGTCSHDLLFEAADPIQHLAWVEDQLAFGTCGGGTWIISRTTGFVVNVFEGHLGDVTGGWVGGWVGRCFDWCSPSGSRRRDGWVSGWVDVLIGLVSPVVVVVILFETVKQQGMLIGLLLYICPPRVLFLQFFLFLFTVTLDKKCVIEWSDEYC